ncbi:uncharacterized protein Z518_11417 [Rhinocladiella mackenziei CBS 650.93]|uniref:Chromo domain-containing protein n=1 Tax=Rhinocladiella mackenziei CBS 650.93 TaxID=1442369 RepID=A0A0D2GLT3_9EURO|nr:uncharacterized protein Z518_11417 [Rhinocladiella mackenziei CBS 650.93]KIW99342.1 hypothetical protein Z518_11417 [Rhinocladiella mackenziei CBS 650.93]
MASTMKELHQQLRSDLEFLAERMAKYANKRRIEGPILEKGDPVYLLRKNIKTKRPSAKLDYTKLGPFRIKDKLGDVTYRLELPKDMRIHNVFHKALLEPAPKNAKLVKTLPLDEELASEEYDVEKILKRRVMRGTPQYLIKWLGYDDCENSWEPEANLSEELLRELRQDHPEWFRPALPPSRLARRPGLRTRQS